MKNGPLASHQSAGIAKAVFIILETAVEHPEALTGEASQEGVVVSSMLLDKMEQHGIGMNRRFHPLNLDRSCDAQHVINDEWLSLYSSYSHVTACPSATGPRSKNVQVTGQPVQAFQAIFLPH